MKLLRYALLAATAVALLAAGGDLLTRAAAAFAQKRYADAAKAYAEAVSLHGAAAAAELHYDHALAALLAADLDGAAAAALLASAGGDDTVRGLAEHLRGTIEWQRAAKLAVMAEQVEAEPFLYTQALERLARARAHWQEAASGATPQPTAIRNVERALLRWDELQAAQAEKDRQKRAAGAKQRPMAVPEPKAGENDSNGEGRDGKTETHDNPLAPLQTELTQEEVQGLFLRLEQKEQQKLAVRRAQRTSPNAAVERDW